MPRQAYKRRKTGNSPPRRAKHFRPSLTHHASRITHHAPLLSRLSRIKLLLCDVDGVLTDASVYVGGGTELKRFNIRDGLGLATLRREGLKVGWLSSRPSAATAQRAEELKIDFLLQSRKSKVAEVEQLLAQTGLEWEEVCYAGDNIIDLGVLKRAGVAVAVANGVAETKAVADYITRAGGGHGAVREVAELILKAQNKWGRVVADYAA